MIAHVPGHLCAADAATALGVPIAQVYRLAHRLRWRTVRRKGEREVYYRYDDIQATTKEQT